MKKSKEYTIETEDQTPFSFCANKYLAIIRCLLAKKAVYVFEFEVNEDDDYELVGCVFHKGDR